MNRNPALRLLLALLLGCLVGIGSAWSANTGVERFHLKHQNCHWTPEIGQFIFDCLKRGDGFGAHWCHNGAMDKFCPAGDATLDAAQPVTVPTGNTSALVADGTTKLERFHLRHGDCQWTPEMGQFIYDCLKRNDGFGAHWCHNGAMEHFCPSKGGETRPADAPAQARPTDSRSQMPGAKG